MRDRVIYAIGALIILIAMAHTAYAAFPYNATWLNYADKRLVYQIDTSGITSNTANIYVTISIDPATLQDYINKWADYCDPEGIYPWFYPTFTYASTANNGERMLQLVEFNSWQTFTVGSCGTVELPTQFTIVLPNGILDGGDSYATYTHYIYAYLKYPFSWDFYDTVPPVLPQSVLESSGTMRYSSTFEEGQYYEMTSNGYINTSIPVDTSKRIYLCVYNKDYGELFSDLWVKIYVDDLNHVVTVDALGHKCIDISSALEDLAGTGQHTLVRVQFWDDGPGSDWYYLWLLPNSIIDTIYKR